MPESFSVLLPIYWLTVLEHFRETLLSIKAQTLRPSEVVIVVDGPIPDNIKNELMFWSNQQSSLIFNIQFQKKNRGLGISLNAGLAACTNSLVARIDADDIATPDRFQCQFNFMRANPDIDVVGSWMSEFDADQNTPNTEKVVPLHHEEIVAYAYTRNPMNHPTVMFRKEAVVSSGGYQGMPFFEDYYLWARMIKNGFRFSNIPKCLLLYRMDESFYDRRKGLPYILYQFQFFYSLYKLKFISLSSFFGIVSKRSIPFILPLTFRKRIYQFLRTDRQ